MYGTPPTGPGPAPRATRCPVCGARDARGAETGWRRCGHCGLGTRAAPDGRDRAARALDALLRAGPVDVGALADEPLRMDAYTLRSAASARGLGFEPLEAEQREALVRPHSTLPARGRLAPFAPPGPSPGVTLGMIVRASELEAALAHARRFGDRFAGTVVAVDADGDGSPERLGDGTLLVRHRLGDDFGAQRNRVQRAAATPWTLQLDADEDPDPGLLDAMDALAAQADRHGLRSIGLPRRNLVDGALSELYPDVQYRLNRREVRYAGRVHERPDLGGEWRLSMIAPAATLAHRLSRARVLERSARYEAMRAGAGRPGDEAALLRPFSP